MTYQAPQPPIVDGIMQSLTDDQKTAILTKLQAIQAAFTPTDFQATCDTFYLVATYNQQNPTEPINGDTAQAILAGVSTNA